MFSGGAMSALFAATIIGLLIFCSIWQNRSSSSSFQSDGSWSLPDCLSAESICASVTARPVSFSWSSRSNFLPASLD